MGTSGKMRWARRKASTIKDEAIRAISGRLGGH